MPDIDCTALSTTVSDTLFLTCPMLDWRLPLRLVRLAGPIPWRCRLTVVFERPSRSPQTPRATTRTTREIQETLVAPRAVPCRR
eukprot:62721-Prymnesium_polylepis.1